MKRIHYRTVVLSDLHLGTKTSKAKQVIHFLKHIRCETLLLNGDIIDGWQLRKNGKWKKQHSNFFKYLITLISKSKCNSVIYLRGNHDDFLDEVMPFSLGNFKIKKHHTHHGVHKKYFVTHGDIFDPVTSRMRWVAKLGDTGYTFLLWLNRHYNTFRERRGLPYYSLSQIIKAKVKSAVSFIADYESELVKAAKMRNCDGVICGHIHQPAVKIIDGIEYLNSGDWVETLSALVEDDDGNWKIIYYAEWLKEYEISKTVSEEDPKKECLTELQKTLSTDISLN